MQDMSELQPVAATEENRDARLWGTFCHLAGLAMLLGIPLGNVIGPLIVWLIKKDEYEFVDDQGKEALNFQITVAIAMVVSAPLVFVIVGIPLLLAVFVLYVVFTILATVRANAGERYRYPFALRLIH